MLLGVLAGLVPAASAFHVAGGLSSRQSVSVSMSAALKATEVNTALKMEVLQLAAALDRGQSYNPTSSDAYTERMAIMTEKVVPP